MNEAETFIARHFLLCCYGQPVVKHVVNMRSPGAGNNDF